VHLGQQKAGFGRCGNINWAKRTKCNICNTARPGLNEGGAREGRAGGYKEFDEAEIEETKRRRRELEEVCAVCYQIYVIMFGLKISACGLL
jgi:hypothetical protein